MNKNLIVVFAVVIGLVLLGGAVFAVSKFGGRLQQAMRQPSALVTPATNSAQPNLPAPSQVMLNIATPVDKSVVKTPSVKISGTTVPKAEVSINEINVRADDKGSFSADLDLDEGENPITVDAFDADGNSNSADLTVTYEP